MMLIKRKTNPLNLFNPRFIVPRLNVKQLGIPKYFGKIPKQKLAHFDHYFISYSLRQFPKRYDYKAYSKN